MNLTARDDMIDRHHADLSGEHAERHATGAAAAGAATPPARGSVTRGLWSVTRLQATLILRGRATWLAGGLMVMLGLYAATWLRQAPWTEWGQINSTALWLTLLLTFGTGDAVARDRERRLDGVLLSTPVSTATYVVGKYLGALIVMCGLAALGLLTAILTDAFVPWHAASPWQSGVLIFGNAFYPSLGARPYLIGWLWLMTTPLLFGAALMLAAITLARGQHLLACVVALLIWAASTFSDAVPSLLDVTAFRLSSRYNLEALSSVNIVGYTAPSAALQRRVAHLAAQAMPPHLPAVFYWNRLLFVSLSLALVGLTIWLVSRRRRAIAS